MAVPRRKSFEAGDVPAGFWQGSVVRTVLARRDIAGLLRLILQEFGDCTQSRLALLIGHDRADVSSWIRGIRNAQVSDIAVLERIADGLEMPDSARVTLGLAPASAPMTALHVSNRPASKGRQTERPEPVVAICGSLSRGCEEGLISNTIRAMALLVLTHGWIVHHGPVGVGIQTITYLADHFQPPGQTTVTGRFGHRTVVAEADYVVVVGGGAGTRDEVDLAWAMGKRVIAFEATGGTAAAVARRARDDGALRAWIPVDVAAALDACHDADTFAQILSTLITRENSQ